MKKTIAMKWVAALRSGNYRQGTGQFRDRNNKFCCLGVLCDISNKVTWRYDGEEIGWTSGKSNLSAILPNEILKWSGISTQEGSHKNVRGGIRNLTSYNDGGYTDATGWYRSFTFTEIADWIEKNYKCL